MTRPYTHTNSLRMKMAWRLPARSLSLGKKCARNEPWEGYTQEVPASKSEFSIK